MADDTPHEEQKDALADEAVAADSKQEEQVSATAVSAEPLLKDAPMPLSSDEVKARRKRNIAIAVGIFAFIAIVYATTILRYAANNAAGG